MMNQPGSNQARQQTLMDDQTVANDRSSRQRSYAPSGNAAQQVLIPVVNVDTYKDVRIIALFGAFILLFVISWLASAWYTVIGWQRINIPMPVGVLAHIVTSVLESGVAYAVINKDSPFYTIPLWMRILIVACVAPLSLFNVATSTIGLVEFAQFINIISGDVFSAAPTWAFVIGIVPAAVMCWSPEPGIAWCVMAVRQAIAAMK